MTPTPPDPTAGGDLSSGLPDSDVANSGELPAPFGLAEAQILGLALALSAALLALLRPFGLARKPWLPWQTRAGEAGGQNGAGKPTDVSKPSDPNEPGGVREPGNASDPDAGNPQ